MNCPRFPHTLARRTRVVDEEDEEEDSDSASAPSSISHNSCDGFIDRES